MPGLVSVEVRSMTDADFDQVAEWLSDPFVGEWFDVEPTLGGVAELYGPRIASHDPTTPVMIAAAGRDVGWGQYFLWAEYEPDHDDLGVGIDFALGAPARGHALGPLAVDAVAGAAIDHHRTELLVSAAVDPLNPASRATLGRAGFRERGRRGVDGQPCVVFGRPARQHGLASSIRATLRWFEVHSGWAPPPPETLEEWAAEDVCRAPDDCLTHPDRPCRHGLASWATVLRYSTG